MLLADWLTDSLSNSAINAASERDVSCDTFRFTFSSSCVLVSQADFTGHAVNLTVDDPGGGGKIPGAFAPPVADPAAGDLIFREEGFCKHTHTHTQKKITQLCQFFSLTHRETLRYSLLCLG